MGEQKKFQFSDVSRCELCGECLSRCPELSLTLGQAKKEKARINRGEISRRISKACTSCFNCNAYCPNDARPCDAIVRCWHDDYKQNGLRERARYFMPLETINFRSYVTERLPEGEKKRLASWDDTSPCEEFIYPGCNVCTVPYLTETSLLPDIPIRGGLDWCCGETFFRMGYYDLAEAQGRRLQARFREMGAKEILMMCTAGTAFFSVIMPERLGIKFDAKFKPLVRYLWEKLESGQIEVQRMLNLRAAVQDSCYSKFLEPDYVDLPRRILERIGVEVVEVERSKEDMACCGIGAGFSMESNFNPVSLTASTLKRIREAKKTGADILCAYCAGCIQMIGAGSIVYPGALPVYHLLELVQMAAGERPAHKINQRARTMLLGTVLNQFPRLLRSSRFFPKPAGK